MEQTCSTVIPLNYNIVQCVIPSSSNFTLSKFKMVEINQEMKIAEYGSWSSPITAEVVVKAGGLPYSTISEIHTCLNAQNEGREYLRY